MFKTRDIVIGGVVLVVLIAGALIIRKVRLNKLASNLPIPTPNIQELQKTFNGLVIPTDRETVDLKDVTGEGGMGVAARKYEGGTYSLTIIANLPDPKAGYFYEGWLVRGNPGDDNFAYISTGRLDMAKGGYINNFSSTSDYSDYKGVVVTLEKVNDKTPEAHVLEGSY